MELDLSNNLLIIYLSISGNQLTALDLSNHLALRWILVNNNQLTVLELPNTSVLEWINADSNQLTALNVSNNPNLGELSIRYNYMLMPDDVVGWDYIFDYVDEFFASNRFFFHPQ